jgi:1-phosphofructokinase family hexose kinase
MDRTMKIGALALGGVHRSERSETRGGGKGVNVARALRCLGRPSEVLGFVAGHTGAAVLGLLRDESLEVDVTRCSGETRSCLTVIDDRRVTVFNESGPAIEANDWDRYRRRCIESMDGGVFVCSGSWPPGAPADAVALLVEAARERGCFTICDTARSQLKAALAAEPDAINPNIAEACEALGRDSIEQVDTAAGSRELAIELAEALLDLGPRNVIVSAGSYGAALAQPGATSFFEPPPVDVVNPIGAGDSLVAGLALRVADGSDLDAAMPFATAVAAASCETFAAGSLDASRVRELIGIPSATASRSSIAGVADA